MAGFSGPGGEGPILEPLSSNPFEGSGTLSVSVPESDSYLVIATFDGPDGTQINPKLRFNGVTTQDYDYEYTDTDSQGNDRIILGTVKTQTVSIPIWVQPDGFSVNASIIGRQYGQPVQGRLRGSGSLSSIDLEASNTTITAELYR